MEAHTRSMVRQLLLAMYALSSCQAVFAQEGVSFHMQGSIYIMSVDLKRVIVAVDEGGNGTLEHVFLYSSRDWLRVTPNVWQGRGSLSYVDGQRLVVELMEGTSAWRRYEFIMHPESGNSAQAPATVGYTDTAGLVRYDPPGPLKAGDLLPLGKQPEGGPRKRTAACDASPKACVELAGGYLPFPG